MVARSRAVRAVATIGAVLQGMVIVFQTVLAAGSPWAVAAWGGQYTVLPLRLRIASAAAVVVLSLGCWVLLARANLMNPGAQSRTIRIACWAFAAYLALNTLANGLSPSRIERNVTTPVSAILSVCFIVVARWPYEKRARPASRPNP